jgi:vitamin B12 transporter
MKKFLLQSLLLTGVNTPLLYAEPIPAPNNADLEEVVVTATRTETNKNELAAATTVITREDIERLQVRTLPELLKGSTGIDIVQNGGYGQTSSIYMRGTDSDQILVMIDGIKAGSVSLGSSAFELIPVDQIERMEIIRGPQSSLYGSEAIGGVIQIFTRKGKQEQKPTISLNAGGGSYDTHQESGNISGILDKTTYSLGASNLESQGFQSIVNLPAGVSPNPNGYGFRNTAVNARLGHHFDNNAEIEAFFMRAEGTNQYDNPSTYPGPNKRTFVNQAVGITASKYILENWHSKLIFGQTQDDQTNFATEAFNSLFNTSRWNASWLNQLTLNPDHKLTLGGDYRLDQLENASQFSKNSRYDFGIFAELHSKIFTNHFINASMRWDQNQQFGDALTGNIGWRFNWQYGLSAFASFGNAFKAPTFNQLYYPGYGNANLKPESSTSVEVGMSGNHEFAQWQLRAYHTNLDNLINTDPAYPYGAVNIEKAQIDGLESEIGTKLLGWQNKLNMSLINPRNKADNSILPNRAQQTLSYDISRSIDGLDFGAKVIAQGTRRNVVEYFDNNNPTVAGYVTVDLRTAYHIDKNWMVSAKLNNLLDKQYQTVYNYATFGRNFFVTISCNY